MTAVTASFSSSCQTIHKSEVSQKVRTLGELLGAQVLAYAVRFACPRSGYPWRQVPPPDKRSRLRKIYSSTGAGLTSSVYASRRNPWRDFQFKGTKLSCSDPDPLEADASHLYLAIYLRQPLRRHSQTGAKRYTKQKFLENSARSVNA